MNEHLQNILSLIQQSDRLSDEEKAALIKETHATDKAFGITTFKLERTEKVKHTTTALLEETIEELEQKRKAVEVQNRELGIETALEKVRTRTMAMQQSDELKDAALLLFQQVQSFGVDQWACGYNIWEADGKTCTAWMARQGELQPPFKTHVEVDHCFQRFYDANQRGETFYVEEIGGEEIKEHYKRLFSLPEFKSAPQEFFDEFIVPKFQIFHIAYFDQGYLMFITYEPVPQIWDIFKRFAKVFEQTYTRFLDLQRAEAQVREAKIEAALERTRTQSMLMQHSRELDDSLRVFHAQILLLGIHSEFSFLWLPDEKRERHIFWAAWSENPFVTNSTENNPPSFKSKAIDYPLDRNEPATAQCLVDWKSDDPLVSYHVPPAGVNGYFAAWQELCGGVEHLKPEYFSDGLYYVEAFMKYGCFGVMVKNDLPEDERRILLRFATEFERTYTRFLDLQKAEAQALEAIKRASVDRVRAEIASMRTTRDLEKITPLIWSELTILEVPFIRCGVFIMDEEQQKVHTFLSTPEGRAIATLHVPFEFDLAIISNGVSHWRKKEVYKEYWDATAFIRAWSALSSLGETSGESNQLEQPPENLYLHLLPFLQGMLYVGNHTPLAEDKLQLIQNLADAFSTAYARYEDFNKLEAAKKQVDSTLTELQATQKQLIQAEKMASLGELTAGIAHEIQNPLNFVNNFSEVNKELLAELNEEIEKGNFEEVKSLVSYITGNEEKISHHGKRADSIVKGMLQHSRSTSTIKEPTDINLLADEYFRLAYHGLRAKDKSFNATLKTSYDEAIGNIQIIPQDIGRVILNIISNAFYAVNEKKKLQREGYEPFVSLSTRKNGGTIEIRVADNGNGIPQKVVDKIFQPFFTTKPTGVGTGLGLSLAYDIVNAHGGQLKVATTEGEGSEFIFQLPV